MISDNHVAVGPASASTDAITRRALRAALELDLLTARAAVGDGVRCRDLSQSNGVALIESGRDRWVVKDASKPPTAEGSWRRELAVYRNITDCEQVAGLAPGLIAHSETHRLFIVEALVDQWLRFDRCDLRTKWSGDVARNLGRALARWHTQTTRFEAIDPIRPWLLDARTGDRLEAFKHNTKLAETLDRVLGNSDLSRALERIDAGWRSNCLMHGDIRFANVFFHVDGTIRLIDWETAGWGDARWDVAGALQEFRSTTIQQQLDTSGHQDALLEAYESTVNQAETLDGLQDFVAARLALRATQLAGWPEATDEHVEIHLDAAIEHARIGHGADLAMVSS